MSYSHLSDWSGFTATWDVHPNSVWIINAPHESPKHAYKMHYISCEPSSTSRKSHVSSKSNYRILQGQLMFPLSLPTKNPQVAASCYGNTTQWLSSKENLDQTSSICFMSPVHNSSLKTQCASFWSHWYLISLGLLVNDIDTPLPQVKIISGKFSQSD